MKPFSAAVVFCLFVFISCNTSTKKNEASLVVTDHAPEATAIKKVVDDAYRVISFKQAEQVNFDSIKTCFMPTAQLFNFRNDSLEVLTIGQFVDMYKTLLTSNTITSFYEEEIKGTTEQFGRIAQRISTYKTYINTMDSVAERGVNSFQLIKTDKGWKVSGIIWDIESPKLKIPDHYLKNGSK